MVSCRNFEEEMLASIDVEAIAREFDTQPAPEPEEPKQEPKRQIPTAAESTRCKKTGKVQFKNALIAIEALKRWKMVDPKICWDLKRVRVYKCKKCHQFHLGKSNGIR
jgi:hypothetical protein